MICTRLTVRIVACCATLAACSSLSAQPSSTRPVDDERPSPSAGVNERVEVPLTDGITYRQVLVPAEKLTELARGSMPIKKQQFLDLIRRATGGGSASEQRTWIESAEYWARYEPGRLVGGRARLHVRSMDAKPSLLDLAPCQLAIGPATWMTADGTRPASIGMDAHRRFVARVAGSADLVFPWSLSANAANVDSATERDRFQLRLPPSPRSTLWLDLPLDQRPELDAGVAMKTNSDVDQPDLPHLDRSRRRWQLELGGHTECQLEIRSKATDRDDESNAAWYARSEYLLRPGGLELTSQIDLDLPELGMQQLTMIGDASLHLTVAELDGEPVQWAIHQSETGSKRTIEFDFGRIERGVRRKLTLRSVADVVENRMWRLPNWSPSTAEWCQDTVTIQLDPEIDVRRLEHSGYQPIPSTTSTANGGMVRRFQALQAHATVRILVSYRRSRVSAQTVTRVELAPGSLRATLAAHLTALSGQRFLIEADVPIAWTIDGIESEPAGAIEDYRLDDQTARARRLSIQLSRPISPTRPLALSVRAHRTGPIKLRAADFRPLRFRRFERLDQFVAIVPDPQYGIHVTGDADVQWEVDDLPEPLGQLLPDDHGSLQYRDDEQADRLGIRLTQESPAFRGRSSVKALVETDRLVESYSVRCVPESKPLSRILIHLAPSRGSELTWELTGSDNQILSARQLPSPSNEKPGAKRGETWEIVLRKPTDRSLELRGQRSTPWAGALRVSVATLPEATSQECWLSIAAANGRTPSVTTQFVKPVALSSTLEADAAPTLARYRYDASRDARVTIEPPSASADERALKAWSCCLTSHYRRHGPAVHYAVYRLENYGRPSFEVLLPTGARLIEARVDGRIDAGDMLEEKGRLALDLSPGKRFPRVELVYSLPHRKLGLSAQISAPFPTIASPVLQKHWSISLPVGYAPWSSDSTLWPRPVEVQGWTRRLLGPLAAGPESHPFNFFNLSDWKHLGNRWAGRQAVPDPAKRILRVLGENLLISSEAESRAMTGTWRQVLSSIQGSLAADPGPHEFQCWVEATIHDLGGIVLDEPIPHVDGRDHLEAATRLLLQAQLRLAVDGDIVLLTCLPNLAQYPDDTFPTSNPSVVVVRPSSRLSRQMRSLPLSTTHHFLTWGSWLAEPSVPDTPWKLARSRMLRDGLQDASAVCHVSISAADSGRLTLIRQADFEMFGWVFFLISAGIFGWLGYGRPRLLVAGPVAAATAALLTPPLVIPMTSGIFLGSLAASLIVLLRFLSASNQERLAKLERRSEATSDDVTSPTNPVVGAGLLLAILFQASGGRVAIAQDTAASEERPVAVAQILVPVDDQRQPVGDYLYLPLNLYDRLHQLADNPLHETRWIVRRAEYRAVMNWGRSSTELGLTGISARYDIDVLKRGQRQAFPWPEGMDRTILLEARLNDRPLEYQWSVAGDALLFDLDVEGPARLELELQPIVEPFEEWQQFEFNVPPVAQAQMKVEIPDGAPTIQLVNSLGSRLTQSNAGIWEAGLGPIDRLHMRWPRRPALPDDRPTPEVRQLTYLHINEETAEYPVTMETQLHYRVSRGEVRHVALTVDRRLQLIDLDGAIGVTAEDISIDSIAGRLEIPLAQPATRDFLLTLRFRLARLSKWGRLTVPRCQVLGERVVQQDLAISWPANVECQVEGTDGISSQKPADFLQAWGAAIAAPRVCFRIMSEPPPVHLTVRAQNQPIPARQNLTVSVRDAQLDWIFQAEMEQVGQPIYQHTLTVPRLFQLKSVDLYSQGKRVPCEARPDKTGQLTVFPDRALHGDWRLVVAGTQRLLNDQTEVSLPPVSLQDVELSEHHVRIYRRDDVLVTVQTPDLPNYRVPIQTGPTYNETLGRLIAEWDHSASSRGNTQSVGGAPSRRSTGTPATGNDVANGVMLLIRPNAPELHGHMATRIERQKDLWQVTARLTVNRASDDAGVIDKLRLDIPTSWAEPFHLKPEYTYSIRGIPGRRRQLTIRLPQPTTRPVTVEIVGALALTNGQRAFLPDIVPLDLAKLSRYVILPTQFGQQHLQWETRGLQPAPLSEAWPSDDATSAATVAHRVWTSPSAVVADSQPVARKPVVRLADVTLAVGPTGDYYGVTEFSIDPAGRDSSTISIPKGIEPVAVTVENAPALGAPTSHGLWQVPLHSDHLPQQLSVVFRRRTDGALPPGPPRIRVPWIKDARVERTLWTLQADPGLLLEVAGVDRQPTPRVDQDLVRLRTCLDLLETGDEYFTAHPSANSNNWYSPWIRRLTVTSAWMRRAFPRESEKPNATALDDLLQRTESKIQRFKSAPTGGAEVAAIARVPSSRDLWDDDVRPGTERLHYVFDEGVSELTLSIETKRPSHYLRQAGMAATVLLLGAVVLAWGIRRKPTIQLGQWPFLIATLIGIGWWLWAQPSILGWLVVLAGVWGAWRAPVRS